MYDIPIYFYMLSNISIFRNTTGQPMGVTEQGRFTFFYNFTILQIYFFYCICPTLWPEEPTPPVPHIKFTFLFTQWIILE